MHFIDTGTDRIAKSKDAILQDPMNYKPNVGGSISGGDTGNFDSNGFNSDMKTCA